MNRGFRILVLGLVVGNYTLAKTLVDDGVIRDIYSLESLFWERQCQFLPVSPPSEEIYVHSDSTVVAVDWAKFPPEFTKEMYAQMDANGYPIYKVLIYEDPITRETVFLNSYGTEVYRLSPAVGYDPYAWQKETFQVSDVSELSEWTRWIFDPAHIAAEISLIPETFHEDYLATQEALAAQEAIMMPMMLSLPSPVTNLVMGIDIGTNGAMEVEIGWPSSFTNFIEIFASTNLIEHQWQLVCTNIATTNSSTFTWTDTASTNLARRCYAAGNADLDSDSDGLVDARERYLYGTDPQLSDTDDDSISDYDEINGTPPTDPLYGDTDGDGMGDAAETALNTSVSSNGSGGVLVIVPETGWYHATDPDMELVYLGE